VVSLHGSDVPFHNPRFRSLDRWILKRSSRWMWKKATKVVTVSDDLAKRAQRSAPQQPIETIYTGVDTHAFVPPEDLLKQGDNFRILYVGRLSEVKAPNLLLDAFVSISQTYDLATLDFVGDGPMLSQLKEQVRANKLTDRVTFHGRLPFENLPAIYAQAHVQVVPSLNEALGNIVLEAMACGLPVITSQTGAAELIDNNGVVTPKGDSSAIASALKTLMDDPQKRHDMAKRSLELSADYTWDHVAAKFKAMYEEAIAAQS
jgi:teichuronic acid biosynthesis glycosyltransferase TuaC